MYNVDKTSAEQHDLKTEALHFSHNYLEQLSIPAHVQGRALLSNSSPVLTLIRCENI